MKKNKRVETFCPAASQGKKSGPRRISGLGGGNSGKSFARDSKPGDTRRSKLSSRKNIWVRSAGFTGAQEDLHWPAFYAIQRKKNRG